MCTALNKISSPPKLPQIVTGNGIPSPKVNVFLTDALIFTYTVDLSLEGMVCPVGLRTEQYRLTGLFSQVLLFVCITVVSGCYSLLKSLSSKYHHEKKTVLSCLYLYHTAKKQGFKLGGKAWAKGCHIMCFDKSQVHA